MSDQAREAAERARREGFIQGKAAGMRHAAETIDSDKYGIHAAARRDFAKRLREEAREYVGFENEALSAPPTDDVREALENLKHVMALKPTGTPRTGRALLPDEQGLIHEFAQFWGAYLDAALSAPSTDERVVPADFYELGRVAGRMETTDEKIREIECELGLDAAPPEPMAPAMAPAKDDAPPKTKPDATGEEKCGCGDAECRGPADNEHHQCGGPHEACCVPGCRECGAPSPEAAVRCQHHGVFCVGCESCARVQGAALRTATAELERVRGEAAERVPYGWLETTRGELAEVRAELERVRLELEIAQHAVGSLRAKLEEAEAASVDKDAEISRLWDRLAAEELDIEAPVQLALADAERRIGEAVEILRSARPYEDRCEEAFAVLTTPAGTEAKAKEAEREKDACAALVAEARDQRDKAVFAQRRADRRIAEAVAYCEGALMVIASPPSADNVCAASVLRLLTPPAGTETK